MEPVRQDREGHAQVCRASRWRPPLRPSAQLHTACGDTETRRHGDAGWGGRHLTYPAAGSVRETAGSGRSRGRATEPRSVSSGPPRPNAAPPARAVRKSQVRKSPPPTPPPPPPLPGRESLCGCVLMTSCRSGFSSAHSSTGAGGPPCQQCACAPFPARCRLELLSLAGRVSQRPEDLWEHVLVDRAPRCPASPQGAVGERLN